MENLCIAKWRIYAEKNGNVYYLYIVKWRIFALRNGKSVVSKMEFVLNALRVRCAKFRFAKYNEPLVA